MRGGHEGRGVLHLHAGPPLENEGGPRARVRVPRDGGLRPRVVLGGEQAKILVDEGMENHLDSKVLQERWARWMVCSLCDQQYHGVVACALGWACWKTYVGRSEEDQARVLSAVQVLGNGLPLTPARHYEDALSVQVADLAIVRRVGAPEDVVFLPKLISRGTYAKAWTTRGPADAFEMCTLDILRLYGEEGGDTITAASNYARCLVTCLRRSTGKFQVTITQNDARGAVASSERVTRSRSG